MNGEREKFCPECKGLMARDYARGETFCPVCGLTDDTALFEEDQQEPAEWGDVIRQRKQSKYERILKECEKRLTGAGIYLKAFGGAPHEPQDKKARSLVMVDRRIENIIKSLEGDDRITDLAFGKHNLLLDKYNSLYQPITYDEARNSYNRFVKRQNKKVDDFINKILSCAFSTIREDIISARLKEDSEEQLLTPTYFPERFLYTGTARIRQQYNSEMDKIHDTNIGYFRKKQVEEIINNPKAPIIISRSYKSNGKTKRIIFEFMGTHIYMHGDEINSNFENFFLDQALKNGHLGEISKCPGTKRTCERHKDAMIADFRARFSRAGGFHKATFYDAAPYIMPQENEKAAVHSDL